jgi:hypothetical protein
MAELILLGSASSSSSRQLNQQPMQHRTYRSGRGEGRDNRFDPNPEANDRAANFRLHNLGDNRPVAGRGAPARAKPEEQQADAVEPVRAWLARQQHQRDIDGRKPAQHGDLSAADARSVAVEGKQSVGEPPTEEPTCAETLKHTAFVCQSFSSLGLSLTTS